MTSTGCKIKLGQLEKSVMMYLNTIPLKENKVSRILRTRLFGFFNIFLQEIF